MDGHFKVVIDVSFKPSYMLANSNLINGKISWLFVAYMESCLVWAREEMVSLFQLHTYKFGLVYDNTKFRALERFLFAIESSPVRLDSKGLGKCIHDSVCNCKCFSFIFLQFFNWQRCVNTCTSNFLFCSIVCFNARRLNAIEKIQERAK